MKQRVVVEIVGCSLRLLTDEPEAYVKQLAEVLDTRVAGLMASSGVCKTDALLLTALDLLDGQVKETAKRRSLESQITELTALAARNADEEIGGSDEEA